MSLTKQLLSNSSSIELIDEIFKVMSDKLEKNKDELWEMISEKTVEQLKKSTKQKKKRPKTSYSMFSSDKDVRKLLQEESQTELTLGEMSKLVSEKWKNLNEEEKSKYEQLAKDKNES